MSISRKERIRRAVCREPLDFFPSQVDFTPIDTPRIAEGLGVSPLELDQAVDNHLMYAYSLGNAEEYMHNPETLGKASKLGLAQFDKNENIVSDVWGVGWDFCSEGVQVKRHPIQDLKSLSKYVFPDPAAKGLMDFAEKVVAQYGREYFVLAFQHISLFERAWALRSFENLMMDVAAEEPYLDAFFDAIADYQVRVARRFVQTGVDGVRIGDDYGSQLGLLMSPKAWRRYIKPRLARIYAVYQSAGLPVFQHSCGDLRAILSDFVDMGLSVLHPLQPKAMPQEEVEKACGGRVTFFGGIDTQELLPFGKPEEVRKSVESCVRLFGRQGGYIIAPSQEVMSDVPIENVHALVSAIQEFRTLVPRKARA
ncbi:MAG: uroporphyrinogen decarboxylase family protein [Spirochaetia bacterium]